MRYSDNNCPCDVRREGDHTLCVCVCDTGYESGAHHLKRFLFSRIIDLEFVLLPSVLLLFYVFVCLAFKHLKHQKASKEHCELQASNEDMSMKHNRARGLMMRVLLLHHLSSPTHRRLLLLLFSPKTVCV